MRPKLIVVTEPELAVGFRLAGVEVEEASTVAEAEEAMEKLVLGSDYGLVAVSEDLMRGFGDHTRRLIRDAEVPLVVPFPATEANVWKIEDRVDYLAELIRSAIGYHIKLTR